MAFATKWALKDSKNLRPDELDKLFRKAKQYGERAHLWVTLAFNGAFRVSELIHFRVPDFNFQSRRISMVPLKKAGIRHVRGLDGKVRIIDKPLPDPVDYPLPSEVMEMVRKYAQREKLREWLFPGDCHSCHIVKLNCPGGHITKRFVQKTFRRILVDAKIEMPGRGIHSLKHARATDVAKKTKDPFMVKQICRHESVAMSDHYVKYVKFHETVEELGARV